MSDSDKTSILIVDDLAEKLLVYTSVLEELDLDMVMVRSGEEALKQVLKQDFAVILLDVNMPGMHGFETAQLIRGRRRSAHTPIIFLTAFTDEVQLEQGYATGAVDYISTPVVPEILRAKVRVFVELFRMRQQVARQAEEQAMRVAAEESARRSRFLAEASRSLASSFDFDTTVGVLTRLGIPDLADLSLVSLTHEGGKVDRTACAWADPGDGTLAHSESVRLEPWLADRVAKVLASGSHDVVARLASAVDAVAATAASPNFPVRSVVILPLVARGQVLGALTLARAASRQPMESEDISLAIELSGRAGVALDNALLVRNIQENDQRKNEFLAMLSHELRNPLAPVRNALQVMEVCGIDHPQLNWARGVIHRQISHLVRLVDDLLDVSRITRGKIKLQLDYVPVADVVAAAVETSRPLIEARSQAFKVSLPDRPVRIHADPARLAQVLSNLLNNAAKFTPEGGRIELAVSREDGEVVFRVRDSGSGIDPSMLTKIFDLFTQADCSIDRSQGGLGIGLTLVRRLVEMHGGSVEAFSAGPDQGSEFIVRLSEPAHTSEAVAEAEPDSSQPAPAGRVLVVDDNVDAADSLAMLLRMVGHEVRLAYDGSSALTAANAFQPQIILLDIGLPGLNGYEVARQLREQPLTAGSLLIAISGYGQEEDLTRSKEAGFSHHLTKPIDFTQLQRVLSSQRQVELADS